MRSRSRPAGSAVTVGAHLAKYQLMADVAISPASAATILETRRGDERSALETRAAAAGAVLLPDPLSAHGRLFLVSGESAGEEELAEALGHRRHLLIPDGPLPFEKPSGTTRVIGRAWSVPSL